MDMTLLWQKAERKTNGTKACVKHTHYVGNNRHWYSDINVVCYQYIDIVYQVAILVKKIEQG